MLSYADAKHLAEEAINKGYNVPGDQLVVIDGFTMQKDYGWVFFYNSSRYLESNDESYLVAGNSPLIVEKDGTMHWLGTAKPVEEYLAAFESHRRRPAETGQ